MNLSTLATSARISTSLRSATVTEEQIPKLRRRAAVAKEEHERLMHEKRERLAAPRSRLR